MENEMFRAQNITNAYAGEIIIDSKQQKILKDTIKDTFQLFNHIH